MKKKNCRVKRICYSDVDSMEVDLNVLRNVLRKSTLLIFPFLNILKLMSHAHFVVF